MHITIQKSQPNFPNPARIKDGTGPEIKLTHVVIVFIVIWNMSDKIKLDFNKVSNGKLFYDVIYNPVKTNFLLEGEKKGNQIENGKMMFIYQAHQAFTIWHKIMPKIDQKVINLIND